MCSSLIHLAVESHDYLKLRKKLLFLQAEQINKMTTVFTQNGSC